MKSSYSTQKTTNYLGFSILGNSLSMATYTLGLEKLDLGQKNFVTDIKIFPVRTLGMFLLTLF
jgi:hypothetical protein